MLIMFNVHMNYCILWLLSSNNFRIVCARIYNSHWNMQQQWTYTHAKAYMISWNALEKNKLLYSTSLFPLANFQWHPGEFRSFKGIIEKTNAEIITWTVFERCKMNIMQLLFSICDCWTIQERIKKSFGEKTNEIEIKIPILLQM